MKTVTVKEIQELDTLAINKFGIPSLSLMEVAGKAVANTIIARCKKQNQKRVCVVCGLGNNAGDGFVAVRYMLNAGLSVKTLIIGDPRKLSVDARAQHNILRKCCYKFDVVKEITQKEIRQIKMAHVVVDAVFGVGLNRDIAGIYKEVVEAVNKNAKYVVAIDVPSGLDGTTGQVYSVCIKARQTVTFSYAKKGFYRGEGCNLTGKVVVVDIGIPPYIKKHGSK